MANIVVGPIIGEVTDTSARILVELDGEAEITCLATDSKGATSKHKQAFRKNRPGIFSLEKLRPEQKYLISFTGAGNKPEGSVRTFAKKTTAINLAAVSCNFTSRRGNTDLWADLRDQYVLAGKVDLILHIGDQVYADNAFDYAMHVVKDKRFDQAAKENQILETYRDLYRVAWNHPSTRDVLANVSNLMIWDDHEIRDDWGSRPNDRNPKSQEYYIGTLARRVFREYQRQLWNDFPIEADPEAGGLEHHFHKWGEIGVMFLDERGGRSFGRDRKNPFLSTRQWDEVLSALTAKNGFFAETRALVVVTSVPLCYLSSSVSTAGSVAVDDLHDHWSFANHRREQIEMIRRLREWKEAAPGEREVLVAGGDVHVGGYTDILRDGKLIFKQLISSPITNKTPKGIEFNGLQAIQNLEARISASYSYKHTYITRRRNFGVIVARVPKSGQPKIEGTLFEADRE
jgi:hypothetical protein